MEDRKPQWCGLAYILLGFSNGGFETRSDFVAAHRDLHSVEGLDPVDCHWSYSVA